MKKKTPAKKSLITPGMTISHCPPPVTPPPPAPDYDNEPPIPDLVDFTDEGFKKYREALDKRREWREQVNAHLMWRINNVAACMGHIFVAMASTDEKERDEALQRGREAAKHIPDLTDEEMSDFAAKNNLPDLRKKRRNKIAIDQINFN